MITLSNPHSAFQALRMRPESIRKISIVESAGSTAWDAVRKLGETLDIRIEEKKRETQVRVLTERSSGSEVQVDEKSPVSVEELFQNAPDRKEGKGIWLALDSLQDPQNIGAIFRSAAFFGVEGILLTEERSAPLSSTVYNISAGGVEMVPFATVVNLQRAFEKAKDAGLWILGSSEHAKAPLHSFPCDRPRLIVIGNEEKGLRKLTEERCDEICSIPAHDPEGVGSLNASVATAILLHHFCSHD